MATAKRPEQFGDSVYFLWHILCPEGAAFPSINETAKKLGVAQPALSNLLNKSGSHMHLSLAEDGRIRFGRHDMETYLVKNHQHGLNRTLGDLINAEVAAGHLSRKFACSISSDSKNKTLYEYLKEAATKEAAARIEKVYKVRLTFLKKENALAYCLDKIIIESGLSVAKTFEDFGRTLRLKLLIEAPFFYSKIKSGKYADTSLIDVIQKKPFERGWQHIEKTRDNPERKTLGDRVQAILKDQTIVLLHEENVAVRVKNILHLITSISGKSLFGNEEDSFAKDLGCFRQNIHNRFTDGLKREVILGDENGNPGWLSKLHASPNYDYALGLVLPGAEGKTLGILLEEAARELPLRKVPAPTRPRRASSTPSPKSDLVAAS